MLKVVKLMNLDLEKERIFTLKEVANLCGVTVQTARRWIRIGKLRAYKLGKSYRIFGSDLEKFVKDNMAIPEEDRFMGVLSIPWKEDYR